MSAEANSKADQPGDENAASDVFYSAELQRQNNHLGCFVFCNLSDATQVVHCLEAPLPRQRRRRERSCSPAILSVSARGNYLSE